MKIVKIIIQIITNILIAESNNALSEAERVDICAGSNYWG